MRVIDRYINREYNKPFYCAGLCLCKSFRIVKVARRLGHTAKLILCISHPKHSALFGLPIYSPHFYCLIDGRKIDVAFDPKTERERMRNEDVEMTRGITIPW